jgi:tetratricopeptide (TPR) repeat protein
MELNPGFIERYQLIFEKDKSTPLFAPLAEAYRKMGLLKEAKEVCEEGLKHHPNFISGLVAYAKTLLDLEEYELATKALEKACGQNPDNILAQSLLAKCYLKAKKPKEALNSYKMVLFLAPNNTEAQKQVKKLESLSAVDIDEDLFKFDPMSLFEEVDEDNEDEHQVVKIELGPEQQSEKLHRVLSLADAFSSRGDLDKAVQILRKAKAELGDKKEIIKRLSVLDRENLGLEMPAYDPKNLRSKQIHKLEAALRRIEQNRRD